jgi:hypothetical protein
LLILFGKSCHFSIRTAKNSSKFIKTYSGNPNFSDIKKPRKAAKRAAAPPETISY